MASLKTVNKVKNAVLYHDTHGQPLIRIDNVRLSYPFVGTPSEDENDSGEKVKKWRVTAMLPKETHVEAKNLIQGVIKEIIKVNEAKVPVDKWFISDGDDKEADTMADHWLVNASEGRYRPIVRDQKGHVMDDIDKIDDKFYGGCWGHVLIRPWFFSGKTKNSSKTYPKRVSAGLNGVVFFKDDEPFGTGRIDDTDAWSSLPEPDLSGGGDDDLDDDL